MGVHAGKTSDVGQLVFNRYGDQYFLSKIWPPSPDTGRELTQASSSAKWPPRAVWNLLLQRRCRQMSCRHCVAGGSAAAVSPSLSSEAKVYW